MYMTYQSPQMLQPAMSPNDVVMGDQPPALMWGQPEAPRLSAILHRWLQTEVSHAQDEGRRRRQAVDGAADSDIPHEKGPFLAPMFLRYRTLTTPPLVQELRSQCKVSWQVKVFPSIMRAVAMVDDRLYLWNYETGRDPIIHDASGIISAVEIVRPRPGVFEKHVHYLLVIATCARIELLAVHVRDPLCNEICVQKLPDYHLSMTNVMIQCIAKFQHSGPEPLSRIFLGGNDGCVYELHYARNDGWLRNRIYLQNMSIPAGDVPFLGGIVYQAREITSSFMGFAGILDLQVDESRKHLYSLDSKGYIHMWWLGPDVDPTQRTYIMRINVANRKVMPVSIHPVQRHGGDRGDHLCVLMQDGSRVYYRADVTHDSSSRQLVPHHTTYQSDLATCPLTKASKLGLQEVEIGPLRPSVGLEQLGQHTAVEDAAGRSMVTSRVSILIPKNHQQQPQLICTASLGLNDRVQGDAVSIVDLHPLVRQVDTWRQGTFPTTGINIFSVVEEDVPGVMTQVSSSDFVTQTVLPTPRYLAVHSAGVTFITRLRPVELLHVALLHPQHPRGARADRPAQRPGFGQQYPPSTQEALSKLDFDWLVNVYGKVEVAVMLLTLICSDSHSSSSGSPPRPSQGIPSPAGLSEEHIAHTIASRPSQDVIQRAHEQFSRLSYAGHAGLFQFFARVVVPVWSLRFSSPHWEQLWTKQQFHLFIQPLLGFKAFLSQLISPSTDHLHHVWDQTTDIIQPGSQVQMVASNHDSFSEIYELLWQTNPGRPDAETLRTIEALTRRGLLAVVQRTAEALKVLEALGDLSPQDRKTVIGEIRSMELGRIVTSHEESGRFNDALMGELLRMPHALDRVWASWRQCCSFFDPAAVDFYEARKCVLSQQSTAGKMGSVSIQEALRRLERPEVAPCLLRPQDGQASGPVRLEIICSDLRQAMHYKGAINLAMVAAKHSDTEKYAEYWHSAVAEPSSHGADTAGRSDLQSTQIFFDIRRQAYIEITRTLDVLCSLTDSMDTDGSAPCSHSQKVAAITWALGRAAGQYFESRMQRLPRPVLAGELFQSSDRLLHFHLYAWIASRENGEGVWPSRRDLSRIRPAKAPLPQSTTLETDYLKQWLSAGYFETILNNPMQQWTNYMVESWMTLWPAWHIGLLEELAEYCEALEEGCVASCVRLSLAHASGEMLRSSLDFANLPILLPARREILIKAEAAAQQDITPNGRQLTLWLQNQRLSDVASVQLQMLDELPEEAWSRVTNEQQRLAAQQDQRDLENELLPTAKLYEMLHDSYDEAVPHLAIKLLRIKGLERPELKHIFTSTSSVGPWKVSDFVCKVVERHHELVHTLGVDAIVLCFKKLQDAAGIDQGIIHHIEPTFMPLQLVLSGLEEMAMEISTKRDGALLPAACLCNPQGTAASVVPGIVAEALAWPSSRVLYDGYRSLWCRTDRSQTQDLYPQYRGSQVQQRRAVVCRLMAVLGQFTLQWLDRHEQDLLRPPTDGSIQQLAREFPVFREDVAMMESHIQQHVDVPSNVRQLVEACKHRLQSFAEQVRTIQPSRPIMREW
eukprot:Sspe_Gene.15739::Locus_5491_Transcript_1_1_Confidence_1.000_Length_4857::g.15739::m.15739/K14312/NUP155, NUP170, NUP157; nuclear pore complex protein Nup155